MAELVDTRHQGIERAIGAWIDGPAIVDPGPASTIDRVVAALGGREPEAILLTHIHLDHAGGAGTLARRFPALRVYVHEVGAPHLVDPSRLWRSASQLYGDRMEELWGEMLPIDAEQLVALSGGENVRGFEVIHAPGHADHHVVYLDSEGTAYTGDVAGLRISPKGITAIPTPPPEIDLEAWQESLDRLVERSPERVRITHFGEHDGPEQLAAAAEALEWVVRASRPLDRGAFLAALEARLTEQPAGAAAGMRAAMPPDLVWRGVERYWRKRGGQDEAP